MKKEYIIIGSMFIIVSITIIIAIVLKNNTNKPDEPVPFVPKTEVVGDSMDLDYVIYDSFDNYKKAIKDIDSIKSEFSDDIDEYTFNNVNVVIIKYSIDGCSETIEKVTDSLDGNDTYTIKFDINKSCGVCAPVDYILVKKVLKSVKKVNGLYTANKPVCNRSISYKPMMYIYPEKDMDLTIMLLNKEDLTHTYPAYKDEWNIRVSKDSNIFDYNTKRNYYALYWKAYDDYKLDMKTGFVVKGEDTVKFLEEKLEILGLNEREINEFIVYWIDKIEDNKYNYLYFRTTDEVNKLMPLEISSKPDTLIRVIVDIVPLDNYMEVSEQKLTKVERTGFSIVEWGGNIHK